jgi:hypothetical protein
VRQINKHIAEESAYREDGYRNDISCSVGLIAGAAAVGHPEGVRALDCLAKLSESFRRIADARVARPERGAEE